MRKAFYFLALILCAYACGNSSADVTLTGGASLFTHKYGTGALNVSGYGTGLIETSIVDNNGTLELYFQVGSINDVRRATSTDDNVAVFTDTGKVLDLRLPNTLKVGGIYYSIGTITGVNGDLYLRTSSDGITWANGNGNSPIMTQSADNNSIYYNLWNNGIVVIDNVWHIFVECAHNGTAQDGVGLGYSYATMTDNNINFDTNRVSTQIITGGGHPHPVYIPERNAIFMPVQWIDPDSGAGYRYWELRGYTANASDNVGNSASWTRRSFGIAETNVHVSDPTFADLPAGKNSSSILMYGYAQNSVRVLYSDALALEIYDSFFSGPRIIGTLRGTTK